MPNSSRTSTNLRQGETSGGGSRTGRASARPPSFVPSLSPTLRGQAAAGRGAPGARSSGSRPTAPTRGPGEWSGPEPDNLESYSDPDWSLRLARDSGVDTRSTMRPGSACGNVRTPNGSPEFSEREMMIWSSDMPFPRERADEQRGCGVRPPNPHLQKELVTEIEVLRPVTRTEPEQGGRHLRQEVRTN